MCRIPSLFLLRRLEGSTSGDACDFNNRKTRDLIEFFFPGRQGDERNSRHSDKNLRKNAPSYATVKNWVVQFTRGDFSTCFVPRPG